MTDKTILRITIAFCTTVLAYFLIMTAPIIIPVLVASIAELIKTIV